MNILSICMIVKNESKVLARALDCVKVFADEIIIVDTGSTDNTKELALKYTPFVYDFEWCDDFSKARNFSFSKATCKYCMWLDADDIILPTEQQKLLNLKNQLNSPTSPDCIMCEYVTNTNETGKPTFKYFRERIVKNDNSFVWVEPIHEVICPHGNIFYTDIQIHHKKLTPAPAKRNLKIYQKLIKNNINLSPRAQYYYARELFYNNYFKKSITILNKFLKTNGWIENKIDACLILAKCYLYLNNQQKAISSLFQSFTYAPPRANICCELANIFLNIQDYTTAIFWFKLALNSQPNSTGWIEPDYFEFIPAIQLCVCYYHLGEYSQAKFYHELSKKFKPHSPQVLFNEKFFA